MPWETHQDDNGRVYYYNPSTRKSTWEKPEELLTPLEIALSKTGWVEYSTDDGMKYWNNEQSGESVWELPEDVQKLELKIKSDRERRKKDGVLAGIPLGPINGALSSAVGNIQSNNIVEGDNSIPLSSSSKFASESKIHPDRIDHLRQRLFEDGQDERLMAVNEFRSALVRAGIDKPTINKEEENGENDETKGDNENGIVEKFKSKNKSSSSIESSQPNFLPWNDAVKILVKDPGYWVITNPVDRRTYYDQFIMEKRTLYQKELQEKWDFHYKSMMELVSNNKYSRKIKHYSSWNTFKNDLLNEPQFKHALNDIPNPQLAIKLQRFVFHKRLQELRKQHYVALQNTKTQELKILNDQFSKLKINYNSKWVDVYNSLKESGVLSTKVFHLDDIDILIEYENYIKRMERQENEKLLKVKRVRYRYERKCRELFNELLLELKGQGKINVNSTWSKVYPYLKDDERYINICGNAGSTPLELLWDLIEEEKRKVKLNREIVIDIISTKRAKYPVDYNAFLELLKSDSRSKQIPNDLLNDVFESVQEYRKEEERRHHSRDSRDRDHHHHHSRTHSRTHTPDDDKFSSSRQLKRLMNDFYDTLYDLQPPIAYDDTWSSIKSRISELPQYLSLDERDRREVFDKFISRLNRRSSHHSPPPKRSSIPESARDRERQLRDIERVLRNEDLRHRPAGRGLDHGPSLDY